MITNVYRYAGRFVNKAAATRTAEQYARHERQGRKYQPQLRPGGLYLVVVTDRHGRQVGYLR